jgi:hypothetical protein
MKSLLVISLLTIMAFLLLPAMTFAQTYQATGTGPQIAQPLVREGTLAVTLAGVLELGQTTSEVDAESLLSAAGIAPRNGWVADYPVTPDIAAELRSAVNEAAAAGSLSMGTDAALEAYDGVMTRYNLSVRADTSGEAEGAQSAPSYPDTAVENNYYYDYGPPVVTYYAPPVDYAYLYSWVPYPFWWWNIWFPGFFVLADFDVPIFVGGHACFVTNHFFDRDHHRFERINAFDRFHSSRFVNRRAVFGPSAVSGGAATAFRHNRSAWTNRGFGTRVNTGTAPRSGNSRTMHSPSGSRNFVTQGNRTFRTAPDRGNWSGQWNNRSNRTYVPTQRSSGYASPGRSGGFSRPMTDNRSFGRGNATGRQWTGSARTFTPSVRSYSAPAPRQVSPSFGSGRPFEGFRGGSFGGGWRR